MSSGELVEAAPNRHTFAVEQSLNGIALCASGLETICAHELERLGLPCVEKTPGLVVFATGGLPLAVALGRANLRLRTAERVLLELGTFPARDFDELFEGVRGLPWELCIARDSRLEIERVRSHDSALASQTAVQSVAHKAAYARMMRLHRVGRMPETGQAVSTRIYLDQDRCRVGIDTSGEALHKRGYRQQGGIAPLKETLAAGLLFLSGWTRRLALVDPFCGSGSIAIEAALYAQDRAPGLLRHFALESLPFAERTSLRPEREAAEAAVRKDVAVRIHASDADPAALAGARRNAERAGVAGIIDFSQAKAEDVSPFAAKGYLLANPPYGERMGTLEEAHELYGSLAGMRKRFADSFWGMGFITNAPDFGHWFGAKPATMKRIMNGAEEQWFHWYPAKNHKD